MKKGQLKALFIEAKGTGQKYIGVMIQTEGSSEPEVIINPKENFNAITALYKQSNASMKATQTQLRSLIDYHFKEAGGYEKVLCDRFLVAPPLFFGENSPRENQDTGE